jgi:purine nucleosidase
MTVALLLDTDIGSDIDDAVALAYLLREPRCELLGITTVSGQPTVRASLADAVCRAAGRPDVPIHAGSEMRLDGGVMQPECPQAEVLGEFAHVALPPDTAVPFLREAIESHPGEVTLLAVGPMTNLARLFQEAPDVVPKLKQVVLMCGWFTGARPEWNASCDPTATAVVFAANPPDLVSVGLDVTMQCRIETDECVARFTAAGGPLEVVAAMTKVWQHGADRVTFNDPLAAALLFEPDLCSTRSGTVQVDDQGGTRLIPGAGPHRVATAVDVDAFFAHYFAVTGAN